MKCRKMTDVCLVQIVQLIDNVLTKIFNPILTKRLCSNLKIFYQESAQLRIPASVTPYDGSLHLHMNLLINTHYHI